ncbi:TPR-like protein [Dioscorea alata]|uniref:TPR-like protein n=1 Tax=Dioscorea alata TaxID=55571 RepID=A0ACB7UG95_DIOAL|nr:TPR-like protein [Dioscorea alata]
MQTKLCLSLLTQSPTPPLSSLLSIHAFLLRRHLLLSGDPFLFNSLLRSLLAHRRFLAAFSLYRHLRSLASRLLPDSYSFTYLLKSCASVHGLSPRREGPQIHGHVFKLGFCADVFSSTALLDMYVKIGDLVSARKVFDGMRERSAVSWTAMSVGYARAGHKDAAMELFLEMPEKDVAAFNAMIDVLVKSGELDSARKVFDEMPQRNVVSWTSLLSGYCKAGDMEAAKNRQPLLALELFRELQSGLCSFEPDEVTLVSIIPAIADMGALELGRWIHKYIQKKGMECMGSVSTALVDMYAKCGDVDEAKRVFDGMRERAPSSWNAMINGLAVNGCAEEALDVFREMLSSGQCPNEVTMMGLLSACNHGGLVDEGRRLFREMEIYGIEPKVEHYGCMVDLLGRRGYLMEAERLVDEMPFPANEIILTSLISACVSYEDGDMAEKVMKKLAKIEPTDGRNFVMLRNLYAGERRWRDVERVKDMIRKYGGKKEAGCSVIEVGSTALEFVSGDKMHPDWDVISNVIGDLHLQMMVGEEDEYEFEMRVPCGDSCTQPMCTMLV